MTDLDVAEFSGHDDDDELRDKERHDPHQADEVQDRPLAVGVLRLEDGVGIDAREVRMRIARRFDAIATR